jgi:hypothetical protein
VVSFEMHILFHKHGKNVQKYGNKVWWMLLLLRLITTWWMLVQNRWVLFSKGFCNCLFPK